MRSFNFDDYFPLLSLSDNHSSLSGYGLEWLLAITNVPLMLVESLMNNSFSLTDSHTPLRSYILEKNFLNAAFDDGRNADENVHFFF